MSILFLGRLAHTHFIKDAGLPLILDDLSKTFGMDHSILVPTALKGQMERAYTTTGMKKKTRQWSTWVGMGGGSGEGNLETACV